MQYTYRGDGGYEQTIEAESMADAVLKAEDLLVDLLAEGDWRQAESYIGCSMSAWVYGPDDEAELAQVDLMPEEPGCKEADEHDWISTVEIEGGTALVYRRHCRHCGLQRVRVGDHQAASARE